MQLELADALPAVGTEPWLVHTEVFDGPLDLLLHLIRRDGIDVMRLSVSRIAEAYLEYLDRMRDLNLSVAGDYLVMAATLVQLKSLELLPRAPTVVDDAIVDPRLELQARLAAYQKLRVASDALDELPRVGREVAVRGPLDAVVAERGIEPGIDAFGLLDLLFDVLKRRDTPPPVVDFADAGPDIDGCCRRLLATLRAGSGRVDLTGMLSALSSHAERVVTFIAALEMIRMQWLDVHQEGHLGPVALSRRVSDEAMDLTLITGQFDEPDADADGQIALPLARGRG